MLDNEVERGYIVMATQRQKEANKLNAQKSTGPKTPEGKAKSAVNRLSFGFASNTIVIPGENPDEFRGLVEDFIAEHQPVCVTEQVLVEKMAQQHWLSLRALRLQGEAFIYQACADTGFAVPKDLGLLIRYQTTADRAFHKAHSELVKAKKQRPNSEIGFESQNLGETVHPIPEKAPVVPINSDFCPEKYGLPATIEELDREEQEFWAELAKTSKKVA